MNPKQKRVLIYYVDGTLPEDMSMQNLMVVSALLRHKGWLEPCDNHPYYRPTQAGLLEFLRV